MRVGVVRDMDGDDVGLREQVIERPGLAALQAVEGAEYAGGAIAWSHTDGLRGRIHHSAAEWLFERRLVKRKKDTSGGTPVYLTTKEGRKLLALARKTAAIQ